MQVQNQHPHITNHTGQVQLTTEVQAQEVLQEVTVLLHLQNRLTVPDRREVVAVEAPTEAAVLVVQAEAVVHHTPEAALVDREVPVVQAVVPDHQEVAAVLLHRVEDNRCHHLYFINNNKHFSHEKIFNSIRDSYSCAFF